MAQFAAPPTYALPVIVDEKTGQAVFNPVWLEWFIELTGIINASGGTSLGDHNLLTGLQGGTAGTPGERYHSTQAQNTLIGTLVGSTYTPTLTSVANISASTAFQSQYLRVGGTVAVSGQLNATATAGATLTKLGVSLPVASNFGAVEDCAGHVAIIATIGIILADSANDRAELQWTSPDAISHTMQYLFIYQVI